MSSIKLVGGYTSLPKGEITGAMDLSPGPIMEEFSREVKHSKLFLIYFLKLSPIKALQLSLVVVLGIGRNFIPSQKNNGIMPLTPLYTSGCGNYFRLNLQSRDTNVVKSNNAEIETSIWNDADSEVF